MSDARRPAVFVDRDGTLIREREYLADPAGVELVAGAASAVRRLREAGFAVVVVTNQSGIARGLFGWDAFRATQARVEALLGQEGARLDGVYVCPHHPDFTGPCECRKPGTALFDQAAGELGLDLERSFFVGDQARDVIVAEALGGTPLLVATGHLEAARPPHVPLVHDLAEAADWILALTGSSGERRSGRGTRRSRGDAAP